MRIKVEFSASEAGQTEPKNELKMELGGRGWEITEGSLTTIPRRLFWFMSALQALVSEFQRRGAASQLSKSNDTTTK